MLFFTWKETSTVPDVIKYCTRQSLWYSLILNQQKQLSSSYRESLTARLDVCIRYWNRKLKFSGQNTAAWMLMEVKNGNVLLLGWMGRFLEKVSTQCGNTGGILPTKYGIFWK